MKKYFTLLIFFILNINIFAQRPPCDSNNFWLTYSYDRITYSPILRTDMSEDIIKSYILMDSLDQLYYTKIVSYINKIGLGPEFREWCRRFFLVIDYDPILLYKNIVFSGNPYTSGSFIQHFKLKLREIPDFKYQYLVSSDYIMHVKAIDTIRRYSPGNDLDGGIITIKIIENFKGKVIPGHKNLDVPESPSQFNHQNPEYTKAEAHNQFSFYYNFFYEYLNPDNSQLIKKDKEYIVFLEIGGVCNDKINKKNYYTIQPLRGTGLKTKLFEIDDGYVIDEYNDMGFGNRVPVEEWKSMLREQIRKLLNGETLDIDEHIPLKSDLNFTLYPNISDDKIEINIINGYKSDIEIYNSIGQNVLTIQNNGTKRHTIDISKLNLGLYFVKIDNKIQKFIKSK